ncbi:hypothetical protein [Rhizobium alvei]|uniref:Transposase n=1 Tax=Rhizobium alvei TaxID=1132659 RepID=A0ABT8YHJ1_9HYPH|nr:hypothetical protein [Rhizobium alvei]MDO6963138.1 hypothetical protein [Rhizobium alvei]
MKIDFRIGDGPKGGLNFVFVPTHEPPGSACNRSSPEVFHVREQAFLFIEWTLFDVIPEYRCYGHWGSTWVDLGTWRLIFGRLPALRRALLGNARQDFIIRHYVSSPGLLPRRFNLHRKALLDFLDRFEARILDLCDRYPFVIIDGI